VGRESGRSQRETLLHIGEKKVQVGRSRPLPVAYLTEHR
jgi:hypothetical protein